MPKKFRRIVGNIAKIFGYGKMGSLQGERAKESIAKQGEGSGRYFKKMGVKIWERRWNEKSGLVGEKFLRTFQKIELKDFRIILGDISKYESPVALGVFRKWEQYPNTDLEIGEVKLNFVEVPAYGKTILFEAVQGTRETKPHKLFFLKQMKKHWQNYTIEKSISHARKCGFKAAGIIDPHFMYWYHNPATIEPKQEVQKRMRRLYSKIAEELGFKEKAKINNVIYWVKRI